MTNMDIRTYQQDLMDKPIHLGLERIQTLLTRLGNPEEKLRVIHIAGTNGKGSVAAYLEATLLAAGYKVGTYTSPSVFDYYERIRMDGVSIAETDYYTYLSRMREAAPEGTTLFELETALAYQYFSDKQVEYCILECGMGGATDATNTIEHPEAVVLGSISYDHVRFLGDTLVEIAENKCGIFRDHALCVIYPEQEVMDTILGITEHYKMEVRIPDVEGVTVKPLSWDSEGNPEWFGEIFAYHGETYRIGLCGIHQVYNALTAIAVLEGLGISRRAILKGLKQAKHPGRFELLRKKPYVIRDGCHNIGGARALYRQLIRLFPKRKFHYVVGILADKQYEEMLKVLLPLAAKAYCLTVPENARALSAKDLCQTIESLGVEARVCDSPLDAYNQAVEEAGSQGIVICFGSLYYMHALPGPTEANEMGNDTLAMLSMPRLQQVCEHPQYRKWQGIIDREETTRIYCKHGIAHCLDVARIAYIINLENHMNLEKDVIYGAALLHDLGRALEYTEGADHHAVGVCCAREILGDTDYTETEKQWILDEVASHDHGSPKHSLLYRADKLSRNCGFCEAADTCYWEEELKKQPICI